MNITLPKSESTDTSSELPLSERGLILLFVADQYGVEHVRVNEQIAALEAAKEGWYNTTVQLRAGIAALEEENKRLRMNLKWALVNMGPLVLRCADYEKWDCMLTALEEGGE